MIETTSNTMRKLIVSALIGMSLVFCAAPLFAQQRQLYRSRAMFIERLRETPDTVCYVFLLSEGASSRGRSYCVSRKSFEAAGWLPYPGPIPDLSILDIPLHQDVPTPPAQPPVDTAKPTPEPPGDATYPNRPAGLTRIGRNDGTVKESGGHAFGIVDFSNWFDHNIPGDIAVVNDPTNPAGSGRSLRFTYPSNDNKAGSANANRFTGGPYREVYVLMRIFHESGFQDFGNKYFYLGAQSGERRNTSVADAVLHRSQRQPDPHRDPERPQRCGSAGGRRVLARPLADV